MNPEPQEEPLPKVMPNPSTLPQEGRISEGPTPTKGETTLPHVPVPPNPEVLKETPLRCDTCGPMIIRRWEKQNPWYPYCPVCGQRSLRKDETVKAVIPSYRFTSQEDS
jgi:predicted RNA-binding Zn-ribbon protein involved in translation (DUF1610 family)